MALFQFGEFVLNSGATSKWKLECEALTADDIRALVAMVRQLVGPFSSVSGVPRGGLALAEALQPFASLVGPHLIVDDVLTTGGSMERTRGAYLGSQGKVVEVAGAVIFARGQCPAWIKGCVPDAGSLLAETKASIGWVA